MFLYDFKTTTEGNECITYKEMKINTEIKLREKQDGDEGEKRLYRMVNCRVVAKLNTGRE